MKSLSPGLCPHVVSANSFRLCSQLNAPKRFSGPYRHSQAAVEVCCWPTFSSQGIVAFGVFRVSCVAQKPTTIIRSPILLVPLPSNLGGMFFLPTNSVRHLNVIIRARQMSTCASMRIKKNQIGNSMLHKAQESKLEEKKFLSRRRRR